MNNADIDLEIWKQLRKKWTDLDASGHKVKVEFKLITDPIDKNKIMAIDVLQNINGEIVTETVQRNAEEAYVPLGIAGLSTEQLLEVYKEMMDKLRRQSNLRNIDVVVTMVPTSPTSGELRGHLEVPDGPVQSSLLINYQQYYVLNKLCEKMFESVGRGWSKVKAIYHSGDLKFHFEY